MCSSNKKTGSFFFLTLVVVEILWVFNFTFSMMMMKSLAYLGSLSNIYLSSFNGCSKDFENKLGLLIL